MRSRFSGDAAQGVGYTARVTTRNDVDRATHFELLRVARKFVRSDADAHDLVQDALMIALDRGLEDWSALAHRAWLGGVLNDPDGHVLFFERLLTNRWSAAIVGLELELNDGHPIAFFQDQSLPRRL